MKAKRFTDGQIIEILRLHAAGGKAADLCRQHGISKTIVYKWKARYGGMPVPEAKRLRTLPALRRFGYRPLEWMLERERRR